MKLVSPYTTTLSLKTFRGSVDSFCRDQLFKLISNFKNGYLVIKEDNQSMAFGSKSSSGPKATIIVNHTRAYRSVLFAGVVGAGEAYIEQDWDSPDLVKVIRFFVANIETLNHMDRWTKKLHFITNKIYHLVSKNSLSGSRKNIAAHYDLSNEFFKLFLDPTMMYSAALFESREDTLEQASLNKLKRLCEKLELKETDHLLEIGTGWGGLAIYAAQHYGCKVTTTTISEKQYAFAEERIAQQNLTDRITLLLKDYRDLEGSYNKIVSVEMIEAVGHQYYSDFFSKCSSLLKPDGLMAVQAITIPGQRYQQALRNVDFIKKYIFPGGTLPSHQVIADHIDRFTDMQILHTEEIAHQYAKTLTHWHKRFNQNFEAIKALGFDDRFIKMWTYYLCYCEGGFRERAIGTAQFLFAKPHFKLN